MLSLVVFFFKQKTAYEMRISDWSSDVCSSDLDGDPGTVVVGTSPDTRHGMIAGPASLEVVAQSGPPREVKIIAEHDGKSTYVDYKYAVEANGHILDPHIIIK